MKKPQKNVHRKANVLLVLFTFLFILVLSCVYAFGTLSLQQDNVKAGGAVFDFGAAAPLEKTHRYYLSGEWEFYYRTFLQSEPREDHMQPDFLPVPSSFAGTPLHRTPYANGGHASYRAYIEHLDYAKPVTIYVPNLACAYRVFVDGQLITESGMLENSGPSWSTPASRKEGICLSPARHEIIIELSAEEYSGLYLTPILMPHAKAVQGEQISIAIRYALAGVILYAAIVLFCISIFFKQRYFSPVLPMLFFCLALRILISTEAFIVSQPLLFSLSYERMTLFIFASTFVIKLVSILYFKSELNLHFPLETISLIASVFLLTAIGVAFLPTSVYDNYYFVILQLLSTIADLFLVNQLCHSFANGNENAATLTLAYFFMLLGISLDALYTNGLLPHHCSYLLPAFIGVFALLLTIVHARRAEQIYHKAQKAKELERAAEKANMSVMISQIQPHFLYNALNTIKSLIRRDPKTAEKAVIDFSYYLRGNMDSLTKTEPIPFEEELQHVKYYCNIELLRFSDKLTVNYAIEDTDFLVPTLSIQPLMENAIKHGVTKKIDGGTVTLSTYAEPDAYVIRVQDDGVGFNPQAQPKEDGRSHVGLQNIQYRFASMLHATMEIESQENVGTTVSVRIPKVQPEEKEKGE